MAARKTDQKRLLRRLATAAENVIETFCLDECIDNEEQARALQDLHDAIAETDT